jgi:twitching motility protein PilJ
MLTLWVFAALVAVLGLSYGAGARSNGAAPFDFTALPSPAATELLVAVVLVLGTGVLCLRLLGSRVLEPVKELAEFSERVAAGDGKARVEVEANNDFAFIAENLNRGAARMGRSGTPEGLEGLQRSISELLQVISQAGRGDLTVRAKSSNDSLGNVVEGVNTMLENYTAVIERARKSALDVMASVNSILLAAEEMTSGATQQDHEITNTSSAVEELTVSMKQVSNNAEASAEAARRALDAAEQGNRAVRDTLEGMQRIRASGQREEDQVAGRPLAGNQRNHQRNQRHHGTDQPAGAERSDRGGARG